MTRRLVCVVEGKGEVEALPNLCSRVRDYLEAWDWIVDPNPVRQPRGWLVDEAHPSPRRPCHAERATRAVQLALLRPADGILLTCDADDDCPAVWGPSAKAVVPPRTRGGAVMAVREYEGWLLHAFDDRELGRAGISDPERIRGHKEKLKRLVPGYKPTTHQLEITRRIDIARLRRASDSFDKLVRGLAEIFEVAPPDRGRAEPSAGDRARR